MKMKERKFTKKQENFIHLKSQGVKNEQAAVLAGYSHQSAAVIACKMMKEERFLKAIHAAQSDGPVVADKIRMEEGPRLKDHYADALTFFIDVMNNPNQPDGMRFEAAKQVLPYQHAKMGDVGKKESRQEVANGVAKGTYSPQAPPKRMN